MDIEQQQQIQKRIKELQEDNLALRQEIHERQATENSLQESETRYRRIVNALTDYIYTVQVEAGKAVQTWHGDGCQTVTGYSKEEFSMDSHLWIRMVPEEDQGMVLESARRLLSGEAVAPIEHRITCKNGGLRWVRNTFVLRFDERGRLQSYDGLIRDITEHKQTEEAIHNHLQEVERFNRLATARELRVIELKKRVNELSQGLGLQVPYLSLAEESTAESDRQGVSASDSPAVEEGAKSSYRRGDLLNWERIFPFRQAEELRHQREAALNLVEDANEARRAAEQAKQALQESEDRLRKILDVSPVPISWANTKGRIEFWNRKAAEVFGYTHEDVPTVDIWYERAYPDVDYRRALVQRWDEEVLESIQKRRDFFFGEVKITCKNGLMRNVEMNGVFSEGRLLVVFNDITERKRAEEELARSEEKFRSIVESSPTAMHFYRFEPDGRLIFTGANPAADRLVKGVEHKQLLGKTIEEAFPKLIEVQIPDLLRKVAQGETGPQIFENAYQNGGFSGFFDVHAFRTGIDTITVTFVDISERKHAEANRIRLEEQLAQAQKMESIGRLAGGIAHDFNNLLAVILGHGELMRERFTADSPLLEDIDEIIAAGERAQDLTRQLLAFSRKQVLEVKVIDLNRVIQGIEKMIRRLLGEDIKVNLRLDSNIGNIRADISQLEQVFMNLCVNARDAMPDGGILAIETGLITLDEHYTEIHPNFLVGQYVVLSVSDTGVGMDEATRQRAFDPFFTTKEKGKGTGLGLATVYGVVKQHGGEIRIYSEPGHGTTFKVYFPQAEDLTIPKGREGPGETILGHGETVLVVEDEPAVRMVICHMLSQLGYMAVETKSVEECLEHIAQNIPIDLLLTDIIMPGMNGRQLYDRVMAIRPGMNVLFMSGYTQDMIGQHGVLEKEFHFISKPFTAKALSRKIQEVLNPLHRQGDPAF